MRREARDEAFREFAQAAIPALHRMAWAMVGDPHHADDLVQSTLEKIYVAWPRIGRDGAPPLAYARRALSRAVIDEARRPWRREVTSDVLPERSGGDEAGRSDDRMWLVQSLGRLTTRQRSAVVLRHLEGMSVAETAEALGMSQSSVKAATAEGMALLSRMAGSEAEKDAGVPGGAAGGTTVRALRTVGGNEQIRSAS